MRYSISMYRGGFQVDSEDCDHQSAKKLGLVCPFCKEAVFFRSGSKYFKDGKQIEVKSSFVHYSIDGDDLAGVECENRSKRQEGVEYLERLQIESKNQRLKFYNDHLWEIFTSDFDAEKNIQTINKAIPQKYRNLFVLKTRKILHDKKEYFKDAIRQHYDLSEESKWLAASKDFRKINLEGVDVQIEKAISLEVFDYLLSKTGQAVLSRLIIFLLSKVGIALYDQVIRAHAKTIEITAEESPYFLAKFIEKFKPLPSFGFVNFPPEFKYTLWQRPAIDIIGLILVCNFSVKGNHWIGSINAAIFEIENRY